MKERTLNLPHQRSHIAINLYMNAAMQGDDGHMHQLTSVLNSPKFVPSFLFFPPEACCTADCCCWIATLLWGAAVLVTG